MTTVHPQVQLRWTEIQKQLYLLEMDLWLIEQEVVKVAAISVYLSPSLPDFTDIADTVALAHTKIGKLRQVLRDTAKGNQ